MGTTKTMYIDNWNDLIKAINKTNTNKETLVLCGYFNKQFRGELFINKLLFKKMPIEVIEYKKTKQK